MGLDKVIYINLCLVVPHVPYLTRGFLVRSIVGTVNISFYDESSDESIKICVEEGKSVLDIALENKLNIEGKHSSAHYCQL